MTDQILNDYARYTDPNGLISGQRSPTSSSGNAILFTAQMVCVLNQRGLLTREILDQTKIAIKKECQIVPGLFRRARNWKDQEGPDDYVGLACIDEEFAQDILAYGRNHSFHFPWSWGPLRLRYYYENGSPGILTDKEAWLGRQQQLIAHWQYAAGETPNFIRRFIWRETIKITGKTGPDPDQPGGQDAWILSAMLLENHFDPVIARQFYRELYKVFPGGMPQVFSRYFADPEHPTAKYWVDHEVD